MPTAENWPNQAELARTIRHPKRQRGNPAIFSQDRQGTCKLRVLRYDGKQETQKLGLKSISFQELIAMADKLVLVPEKTIPAPRQPQTVPMKEAIQQILEDSRQDPEAYLEETVTPHGGE